MGWRLGLPGGLQGTRGHHLPMSHCEAMYKGCIAGGSKAHSRAKVEQGGWFLYVSSLAVDNRHAQLILTRSGPWEITQMIFLPHYRIVRAG